MTAFEAMLRARRIPPIHEVAISMSVKLCKQVRLRQGQAELICWLPTEGLAPIGTYVKLDEFDGIWLMVEVGQKNSHRDLYMNYRATRQ